MVLDGKEDLGKFHGYFGVLCNGDCSMGRLLYTTNYSGLGRKEGMGGVRNKAWERKKTKTLEIFDYEYRISVERANTTQQKQKQKQITWAA